MPKVKLFSTVIFVVLASMLVFGCGSNVDKEMADAEAALQAARDAGAEGLPEYQAAEELIAKAREMMAAGDTAGARALL